MLKIINPRRESENGVRKIGVKIRCADSVSPVIFFGQLRDLIGCRSLRNKVKTGTGTLAVRAW